MNETINPEDLGTPQSPVKFRVSPDGTYAGATIRVVCGPGVNNSHQVFVGEKGSIDDAALRERLRGQLADAMAHLIRTDTWG